MNNIRIQPCYYIQYITTKYSYAEIPSSYFISSLMGNKKNRELQFYTEALDNLYYKQESPRYTRERFTLSCVV